MAFRFGFLSISGGKRRTPEEFARNTKRAARKIPRAAEERIREAAEIAIGSMKKQFQGERTRARFKISGGRRIARKPPRPVSAPGNRLGVFEGTYRKSITSKIVRSGKNVDAIVGPFGIRYARVHEFGIGTPKRPVLGPGIKAVEDEIFELVGTTFEVLDDV